MRKRERERGERKKDEGSHNSDHFDSNESEEKKKHGTDSWQLAPFTSCAALSVFKRTRRRKNPFRVRRAHAGELQIFWLLHRRHRLDRDRGIRERFKDRIEWEREVERREGEREMVLKKKGAIRYYTLRTRYPALGRFFQSSLWNRLFRWNERKRIKEEEEERRKDYSEEWTEGGEAQPVNRLFYSSSLGYSVQRTGQTYVHLLLQGCCNFPTLSLSLSLSLSILLSPSFSTAYSTVLADCLTSPVKFLADKWSN